MYLRYGIPRGLKGLRTNWRANVNTTLILSASLSVLGMIVLLYLNVIHVSELWFSNTKISLFLKPGLTELRRDALLEQVRDHRFVRTAILVSPEEGLRDLAQTMGADHDLLSSAGTDDLPYTIDFEILVDHRRNVANLAQQFEQLPGVDEVVYTERILDQVRLFFLILQGLGGFFIGLILISFFLIISHATKLSLHARQDEIEILTLVGATRRFVRSSFVVEGFLVALLGGLVAIGVVWISHQTLIAGLSWNVVTATIKNQSIFFHPRDLAIALGLTSLMGSLSSFIAVNRLLKDLEP